MSSPTFLQRKRWSRRGSAPGDPKSLLGAGGALAAVAGTGLLIADVATFVVVELLGVEPLTVFLRVPSSGVMLPTAPLFGMVVGVRCRCWDRMR